MGNTKTTTPAAPVTTAIRQYFKVHGITHEEAARRLGQSKQTVSNRLSTGGFTPVTASLWCAVFGFSEAFLLKGKGSLVDDGREELERLRAENESLRRRVRELEGALS